MDIVDVERFWQLRQEGLVLGAERERCQMLEDLALVVHDQEGRPYIVQPTAFKRNLELLFIARETYVRNGWGSPPF